MCFCDGIDFVVTNTTTRELHLIRGDGGLHNFFIGYYSLPYLLQRYIEKEQVHYDGNYYFISQNLHAECEQVKKYLIKRREMDILTLKNGFITTCHGSAEQVKKDIIKRREMDILTLKNGFIAKCPSKYRHLLPIERQ